MADTPIDMHLPDSFHRLKRTVLLFCAALFVLGLAQPATSRDLHSTLLDLTLSHALITWLLWGAAAYYLWGFWLEVGTARRLNARILQGAGAADFDQHLTALSAATRETGDALAKEIEAQRQSFTYMAANVQKALSILDVPPLNDAQVEEMINDSRDLFARLPRGHETLRDTWTQSWQNAVGPKDRINKALGAAMDISESMPKLIERLDQAAESQRKLAEILETVASGMRKLNPSIAGSRRVSFWLWECGGAFAAFVGATLVNIPWALIAEALSTGAENLS